MFTVAAVVAAVAGIGYGIYEQNQAQSDISGASAGIESVGNDVQREGAMSDAARQQWDTSYNTGTFLNNLYGQNVGEPGAQTNYYTAEQQYQNQGAVSQALYGQVLNQAKNPTSGWQSSLQPQLQQAQDQINSYYQSRGLLNSGLAIGSMGQAGVDLAIQNAQNEMAYQQQSLQNANTLVSNAGTLNQNNMSNLNGLYNAQQSYGLQGKQLEQQAYQTGAGYVAYPQQAQLGYGYGEMAAGGQQIGSSISSLGSAFGGAGGGGGYMQMANGLSTNQSLGLKPINASDYQLGNGTLGNQYSY
jgi:hypothetical protein